MEKRKESLLQKAQDARQQMQNRTKSGSKAAAGGRAKRKKN